MRKFTFPDGKAMKFLRGKAGRTLDGAILNEVPDLSPPAQGSSQPAQRSLTARTKRPDQHVEDDRRAKRLPDSAISMPFETADEVRTLSAAAVAFLVVLEPGRHKPLGPSPRQSPDVACQEDC